jgi:uncharacterized repeat protein (TIGR04052 family)
MRALLLSSFLCIAGCSGTKSPVDIPFELRFGGAPIGCTQAAGGFTLTDLRFYVYDVELLSPNGPVPLELEPDPPWQGEEVALLDFEDGQGTCTSGTPVVHTVLRGRAPPGSYVGLRFRIGVPEHLNHGDPLTAAAPLGDTSMHWHWTTGYRFLRAGIASETDGFWIHLGSTRCEGTVTDIKGCKASNRARVELPGYRAGEDVVAIDLARLVADVDLADGAPGDCSSGPAETACEAPFAALGVDFRSGAAVRPAALFEARPAR